MNKELELSKALSKKVIDEISNKLNIKELDLDSTIDTTINILENLKQDLPYSAEKRLWNEFNQSVSEIHKIRGEINAYYFAKQVSGIMKEERKEKELLREELERLNKALDNLSCSSIKYHLVSQAISEIEKDLEKIIRRTRNE